MRFIRVCVLSCLAYAWVTCSFACDRIDREEWKEMSSAKQQEYRRSVALDVEYLRTEDCKNELARLDRWGSKQQEEKEDKEREAREQEFRKNAVQVCSDVSHCVYR